MKKHGYLFLGLAGLLLSGCTFGGNDNEPPVVMRDFEGLSFTDKTVTFSGEEQKIEVSGLPAGAVVSYGEGGNVFTDAGTYQVTATVTMEGYNAWTQTATLTISKADLEGVVFADKTVDYDGTQHTIEPTNLPTGATFEYVGESSFILPGTHEIKIKVSKANYNDKELTATLTINSVPVASQDLVVDDFEGIGDSDLASDWKLEYYNDTWVVPSSASIKIAKNQHFGTGTQSMRMNLSHQGLPFKVTKSVEKGTNPAVYKGFAIDAFADTTNPVDTVLKVQLWLKDLPLPQAFSGYKDTYITYTLSSKMQTNWTHYEIPFDDSSISIAGGNITTAQLGQLGLSLDDVSLYIDKIAVLVQPAFVSGGLPAYCYLDNIKLTTKTTKSVATTISVEGKKFTAKSTNGTVVKFTANSGSACKIESLNLESNFSLNGTYTVSGDQVNVTIPTSASTALTLPLTAKLNGTKLALGTPSGDLASFQAMAAHFAFEALDQVIIVDDFSSYSATGQGYDRGHQDPSKVSGLRAAYYGEVYNDTLGEQYKGPIDTNWRLINDTAWADYIKLQDSGKSGKGMSIVNNKDWQTRYMTGALVTGAQPIGRGNFLSFFVKGSVAQTMKIRVYYDNRITAGNQTATKSNCAYKEGIAIGTDWTQVTVPLEANREVFGFMITPTKANGTIFLDEFELIGTGNPYEAYVAPQPPSQDTYTEQFKMDFQGSEYVANSEIPYTNWTKQKYGNNGWIDAGKMYCKKSNSTNKFINFYCGYSETYKYEYTLPTQAAGIDRLSFKYSNDFSGADISVKVVLIDKDNTQIYAVGDSSNFVTVPAGTGDRMNDGMIAQTIDLPQSKDIKAFRFVVKCTKNGDAYFYVDDIALLSKD